MRNVDQFRHAIDKGLTGDKVSFPDPAAAPLGTDDEAAGSPVTHAQLRAAWEAERKPDLTSADTSRDAASAVGRANLWETAGLATLAFIFIGLIYLFTA
jgi:hypothetical protein